MWICTELNSLNSNKMSVVPEIRNLGSSTYVSTDPLIGSRGSFEEISIPPLRPGITTGNHAIDQMDFISCTDNKVALSIPGFLERLYSVVRDNSTSLVNIILVVIILLIETTYEKTLFTCPCELPNNKTYAVTFVVAPSVALFVLGLIANNMTWQLVSGCWYRTPETAQGYRNGFYFGSLIVSRALIAPAVWVNYAFLDGKFYACGFSSDPCGVDSDSVTEKNNLRGHSQVIGFILMIATITTALFVVLLARACSRLTFEKSNYTRIYNGMERMELQKQFEEHAQTKAKRNVLAFLNKETRSKQEWDNISSVPIPNRLSGDVEGTEDYTPLQRLVRIEREEENRKKLSRPSTGTQTGASE